jgi:molybdopterin-binding protein
MEMSARNQLAGTIKKIKVGNVMTEVVLQVGDQEVVAAITSGSAKRMKLRAGNRAPR